VYTLQWHKFQVVRLYCNHTHRAAIKRLIRCTGCMCVYFAMRVKA